MKKIIALLLALVMVFALVACSSKTTDDTAKDDTTTPADTTETTDNTGDTADTADTAEEGKTIKVGLVLIGDENDQGYTYNFMRGKEAADEKLKAEGINVEWVIKWNLIEGDPVAVANEELVEDGCEIIFNNSYGHEPAMLTVAAEYPDVQFVGMTNQGSRYDDLANTHNAFANIYEGRYVAGVAAGLKMQQLIDDGEITEDQAVIGYVGAYSFAEVVSGFTAYYLGARSVCPSATMKVQFVGSWSDATAEADAAKALIDLGCIVISQHSDNTTPATAAQAGGVYHTGYNNDMTTIAPEASIIGTRIDWTNYFVHAIECVVNGTELEQDWCKGMSDDEVVMTPLNEAIAAPGTAEKLAEVEEGIKNTQAFVALTGNAETNILACLTAKRMGVRKTVAMVENIDYVSMAESLDIGTIINKKSIAASHIYQMMLDANVHNVRFLMTANADVAEFIPSEGSKVTQKPVKDLGLPVGMTIGGLVRDGVGLLVSGNTMIQPGDSVMVFCHNVNMKKIEKFFL